VARADAAALPPLAEHVEEARMEGEEEEETKS
jgi:hypothetical protein